MGVIKYKTPEGGAWIVTLESDGRPGILKATAIRGGLFWIEETVAWALLDDIQARGFWLRHLEDVYQGAAFARGLS